MSSTGSGRGVLRHLSVALLLAALLGAVMVGRVLSEGRREMRRSDTAFHSGKLSTSLVAARNAAAWYLPGVPHVRAARARLRAIALGAEATRQPRLARRAWTAIRQSIWETRHPGAGQSQHLREANQQIARLLAREGEGGRGPSAESLMTELESRPHTDWWALVAGGSFLLMLGGAVLLYRSVPAAGFMRPTRLLWTLLVSGIVLWAWVAVQS